MKRRDGSQAGYPAGFAPVAAVLHVHWNTLSRAHLVTSRMRAARSASVRAVHTVTYSNLRILLRPSRAEPIQRIRARGLLPFFATFLLPARSVFRWRRSVRGASWCRAGPQERCIRRSPPSAVLEVNSSMRATAMHQPDRARKKPLQSVPIPTIRGWSGATWPLPPQLVLDGPVVDRNAPASAGTAMALFTSPVHHCSRNPASAHANQLPLSRVRIRYGSPPLADTTTTWPRLGPR